MVERFYTTVHPLFLVVAHHCGCDMGSLLAIISLGSNCQCGHEDRQRSKSGIGFRMYWFTQCQKTPDYWGKKSKSKTQLATWHQQGPGWRDWINTATSKLNYLADEKVSQGHVTIRLKTYEQRSCPTNKRCKAIDVVGAKPHPHQTICRVQNDWSA